MKRRLGVRVPWAGLILSLMLSLAGCEDDRATPTRYTGSTASYFVTASAEPAPIPLNEFFALTVQIHDGSDHEVMLEDVNVRVDAEMPGHRHGMNVRPELSRNANGSFVVEGMLFHMPGRWDILVYVELAGKRERARLEVTLEP